MTMLRLVGILTLTATTCVSSAFGQTSTAPSAGDGSIGDPYQIATLENLQWITVSSARWDKHYIQTADIDASETSGWGSGTPAGFLPIGNNLPHFTGSYDGGGHTISGLFINQGFAFRVGLFGSTTGATIQNVGLIDVSIVVGGYYVGGLVGDCSASSITNCYSTGTVSGTSNLGGLVGRAYGSVISDSYSSCSVEAVGLGLGGLVGTIGGSTIVNNCYATGSVESIGNEVGGLVGNSNNNSHITNCHATGSVVAIGDGRESIGGLVGKSFSYAVVSKSYATGSVTATNATDVGGLVGNSGVYTMVEYSYATGTMTTTGSTGVGGLVGQLYMSNISNSYARNSVVGYLYIGGLIGYISNATGTQSSAVNCYTTGFAMATVEDNPELFSGGVMGNFDGSFQPTSTTFWNTDSGSLYGTDWGVGKTTAQMMTQSTYTNAGWDFDTVWEMIGTNYPKLRSVPDGALPVELTSFAASTHGTSVGLRWNTATEVDNAGWEVERRGIVDPSTSSGRSLRVTNDDWEMIAFVPGSGTSTSPREYVFTDSKIFDNRQSTIGNRFVYRLKQLDRSGSFSYSHEMEVEIGTAPEEFTLGQNYPNPFNPATTITFTLTEDGHVTLEVFDVLGRQVATLFNEKAPAGRLLTTTFDASRLPSGIYFARLQSGNRQLLKKMTLMK